MISIGVSMLSHQCVPLTLHADITLDGCLAENEVHSTHSTSHCSRPECHPHQGISSEAIKDFKKLHKRLFCPLITVYYIQGQLFRSLCQLLEVNRTGNIYGKTASESNVFADLLSLISRITLNTKLGKTFYVRVWLWGFIFVEECI